MDAANTNQSQKLLNVEYEASQLLGPVRDPLGTVVPMTILYAVVLLTGTVGNICTCIVIARNKYMHTATNFYLFSLAISDLLLLILGLPQELFMLWQKYPYVFGEFFCVVRGLSSETSTNASILTITAFTIERYAAICHPLKSHTMSQLPRAIKTILVIWAVSAICALPVAWQFGIIFMLQNQRLQNVSKQCGIKIVYFEYGFETAAIVFFLMPITLISVLYIIIGINLRRSSDQVKSEPHPIPKEMLAQYHEQHHTESVNLYQRHNSVSSSYQKQIASRRSVIRMLVAVVIAFFFCYSPFHAQRVLATTMHRYNITSKSIQYLYFTVTHISGVTYYLSATINPILYQVMSQKFRIAFKDTFGYCLPCLRKDLPEITYSNIIGGVSSYKLSRTGSFYSNGSFHRQSINFEISTPNSIRKTSSANEFALNDVRIGNDDNLHVVNSDSHPSLLTPANSQADSIIMISPDVPQDNNLNLKPIPCTSQFLNVPSFKF